jgi:hypothetical protein
MIFVKSQELFWKTCNNQAEYPVMASAWYQMERPAARLQALEAVTDCIYQIEQGEAFRIRENNDETYCHCSFSCGCM